MRARSVGAVLAGLIFVIVASTLVDMILHAAGVYPDTGKLDHALALVATSYRCVITIAGAWITARLAPRSPMKHALVLGVLGTVLGVVGVVATWNLDLGPRWYPIALAVLAIPQCWAGGKIVGMRAAGR